MTESSNFQAVITKVCYPAIVVSAVVSTRIEESAVIYSYCMAKEVKCPFWLIQSVAPACNPVSAVTCTLSLSSYSSDMSLFGNGATSFHSPYSSILCFFSLYSCLLHALSYTTDPL